MGAGTIAAAFLRGQTCLYPFSHLAKLLQGKKVVKINGTIILAAMKKSILYLGDTSLTSVAAYPAGILTHFGFEFDYFPSDYRFKDADLDGNYRCIVISDYPSVNFSKEQLNIIAEKVLHGSGFVMLGGWESFTGAAGGYNKTVLTEILPVVMSDSDDRVNCPQGCLVEKLLDNEITQDLPFDDCPPNIGCYNRFKAKPEGQVVLQARPMKIVRRFGEFEFQPGEPDPLLVLGEFGRGRTAAFASDVAPHWVGGLVDWGDKRIFAQAKYADKIEVGNWYAQLFAGIIAWTVI